MEGAAAEVEAKRELLRAGAAKLTNVRRVAML